MTPEIQKACKTWITDEGLGTGILLFGLLRDDALAGDVQDMANAIFSAGAAWEREEIAKIIESNLFIGRAEEIAEAIRARGKEAE